MRIKFSKLSETQTAELMKYFVAGVTARAAADLVGLNRNTVTAFFDRLRRAIARH
jgi:transposase